MSDGLSWGIGGRKPDEFDIEEQDVIERHLIRMGLSEDQIYYGT